MYVGALILIGALLCYLLARHITMPVAQLRTLTSEFSRGDFSARMTLPNVLQRKDEIGGLARDFNVMASRIEVLVNAQHRLIADVSHELRSPLTRLRLALGLLRRRKETDAQTSLARMEREVERLDLLISQLLTLSRLESLSQPPRMEALDLSALVKEVFADADFEATSMDRSVQLLECADCRVRGEADLIRSAMENVVRNALKYSHSKTTVYIRLLRCTTNRTAIITVEDEGPGVPGEMLCHIFEPFYRVDEARDRQTGGAGLGLAISHRITILHGGTIVAANREIGGLAVRIALPICE
jgi:two-component system sensor histidine kinase CpxA